MKEEQPIHIDPHSVPPEEYQTACSVLASSIRLALADQAKRADYEAWKTKRLAKTEKE